MSEPDSRAVDDPAAAPAPDPATCSVCPHPWGDHDRLGVRFCSATMASAQHRGCICRPTPAPSAAPSPRRATPPDRVGRDL